MATGFNSVRTAKIVNGYIREIEQELSSRKYPVFIIPYVINQICSCFLYAMKFSFYKKHTGRSLAFMGNNIVTKTKTHSHSMVAIGECMCREICDRFIIEYLLQQDNGGLHNFYIGFFKFKSVERLSGIAWTLSPEHQVYEYITSSICCLNIRSSRRWGDCLILRSSLSSLRVLKLKSRSKVGDRFKLEFDFIKSECNIYHNDEKIDYVIKLHTGYIIPSLALRYKGETVQISRYQLINNK